MQKVYVSEEEKVKILDKLSRDIEVRTQCPRSRNVLFTQACFLFFFIVIQFLVRMRIMDYSLLLGIHDVERAKRDKEEEETESASEVEEEERDENDTPPPLGSNLPEGISGYMNSFKPMGPGEFDPYVDVYAVQSAEGEAWPDSPSGLVTDMKHL